ncbi:MAG: helix-turn-helix domain-containing protein [Actinomycetota bacterium]|nr:helix-turn-helix domain-containing protein [Actinomycetota bacterium]
MTGSHDVGRAGAAADPLSSSHPLIEAVRPVVDAVGARLVGPAELEPSDVALVWDGETVGAVRMPPLHGALDRLIEAVEAELGGKLADLPRESKQRAIRLLDERGAFILRRAVEDVADAMSVSRITVYNYLNAIHR